MKILLMIILCLLFAIDGLGQQTEENPMLIQLTHGIRTDSHPSWSPDGSQILFASKQAVFEQIFLLDMESRSVNQLTHIQGHARNPSWHPDGQNILFDTDMHGKNEIYILRQSGQQPEKLLHRDIEARSAMLNANANLLLFIGKGPYERHWNVYTYDFTYNNLNKITRHQNHCYFPRWSPRADYISYHQLWKGHKSFPAIMHWYGKPAFAATFYDIPARDLNWSPDGYKILYVVNEKDAFHLYMSRRNGSEKVLLHSSTQKISQPAWAPTGDAIVFCMATDEGSQHLWLLRLY